MDISSTETTTPPSSPPYPHPHDALPTRSLFSSSRRAQFPFSSSSSSPSISSSSSSSSSTKYSSHLPPTTFPLFPLLPLELRLQIYHELTLLSPRVLSITSTTTSTLRCTSSHPSLLSLNRESRAASLKTYFLIRDLEGQHGFYYDPLLDTIHLTRHTKFQQSEIDVQNLADGGAARDYFDGSSISNPAEEYLSQLSQITSSLPPPLGVYSLALRGVSTLPPSSAFLSSGGNRVREIFMLVGPGAHRRGASTYCGVSVGFMRTMLCREMEKALESMDEAGGFGREGGGAGCVPRCIPLVGGGEGEVEERVLKERLGGRLIL